MQCMFHVSYVFLPFYTLSVQEKLRPGVSEKIRLEVDEKLLVYLENIKNKVPTYVYACREYFYLVIVMHTDRQENREV